MLKRNLQAWYNVFARSNSQGIYLVSTRPNKVELTDDQIKSTNQAGFLDLLALEHKDDNVTIVIDFKDLTPVINRGKPCLLKKVAGTQVYISPVLEGYVVPRQGRYQHRIHLIYDFDQLDNLRLPKLNDDTFVIRKTPMSDIVLNKIIYLSYILSRKGISLYDEYFYTLIPNLDTGELLVSITEFIDTIPDVPSIDKDFKDSVQILRQRLPKGYEFTPGPRPNIPWTVLHYELPEIPRSIPERRVFKLLAGTNNTDSTMCMISLGKIDQLETTRLQYELELTAAGYGEERFELTNSEVFAAIHGGDKIEFKREVLIDPVLDVYTYQAEYNKSKYEGHKGEGKTQVIPPDPLEFEYLFGSMQYTEQVRNKLVLEQGEKYYQHIREEREFKPISDTRVTINGIEFKSEQLSYFKGSLFYDIVQHATELSPGEPVIINYLTINDLYILRDFLKGRIMFGTLYQELSSTGFDYLSGSDTLLELGEYTGVRRLIDLRFNFGELFATDTRDLTILILHKPMIYHGTQDRKKRKFNRSTGMGVGRG